MRLETKSGKYASKLVQAHAHEAKGYQLDQNANANATWSRLKRYPRRIAQGRIWRFIGGDREPKSLHDD